MATNLRLKPAAESALRKESARTGRSQQDLIREALDRYLGLGIPRAAPSSIEQLMASGAVLPAREPYRRARRLITVPEGVDSLDLLDRGDRF
ncbi:ribbon-helix-helix protein, CopG family [Parafrigoribacterium humi]|uniref:ribbon-helix-helix protein, CopG family n=1 Tax=Parafrigoribacterium humi TaxID=3144664 RepID=UPI0032ED087A